MPPSKGICAEAMSFTYSCTRAFSRFMSSTIWGLMVRRSCSACAKSSVPYFSSSCARKGVARSAAVKASAADCSSGWASSQKDASPS